MADVTVRVGEDVVQGGGVAPQPVVPPPADHPQVQHPNVEHPHEHPHEHAHHTVPPPDGAGAIAAYAAEQVAELSKSASRGSVVSVFEGGVDGGGVDGSHPDTVMDRGVLIRLRQYPSWVKYIAAVGTMILGSASISSTKWQNMQVVRKCATCEPQGFQGALAQTFQMFVGESMAGICWFVDDRLSRRAGKASLFEFNTDICELQRPEADWYWWPGASVFDFASTVLFMLAQQRCSNAVVTMLRNFMVVMTGIFQMMIIKKALVVHEWIGIVTITFAMVLFALPNFIDPRDDDEFTTTETTIGIVLTIIGTAVQSAQLLYEERVFRMGRYPATKAVGVEGVAGMVICALAYWPFQATLEDVNGSLYQMFNDSMLLGLSVLYCFVAFAFNIIGLATTKLGGGVLRGVSYAIRAPMAWFVNMITGWDRYDTWCLFGTVLLCFGFVFYTSFLPATVWLKPVHICCTNPELDGVDPGHETKAQARRQTLAQEREASIIAAVEPVQPTQATQPANIV